MKPVWQSIVSKEIDFLHLVRRNGHWLVRGLPCQLHEHYALNHPRKTSIMPASYGTNLASSQVLSGVTRQAGTTLPRNRRALRSVGWVSQAQVTINLFWNNRARSGTRGTSGELVMFYFLIWMLVKWICLLFDSSLRYLIICALLCVYTSIILFLKPSHVLILNMELTSEFKLLHYNQCVQTRFIYKKCSLLQQNQEKFWE